MSLPWKFALLMAEVVEVGLDRIPEFCAEIGADRIEGGFRIIESLNDQAFEQLARRFDQAEVKIHTFHLPFGIPIDISDFYETRRREAVQRSIRCMERCARLGVRVGIQHPTTCLYHADVEGIDRFLDTLRRSLDELVPVAERCGLTIALENIPAREYGPRFGSLPAHFAVMRERLDYPQVGFCFDTGHALMSLGLNQEDQMFDAMGDRLVAFHLADNAGDRDSHLAPGRGRVDWRTVFRRAAALGFSGTMCIETPPFAPGPPYGAAAYRELLQETRALAKRALAE